MNLDIEEEVEGESVTSRKGMKTLITIRCREVQNRDQDMRNSSRYYSQIKLMCRWFRFAQLAKGKKFRP